jgi:hypothetical protein
VHSSNGFSDGQPIADGEAVESLVEGGGERTKRTTSTVRRFHALEDSADFSEDSSARRRKRQQAALTQHEQARATQAATTTNALDAPATADSQAPKKKKKKRRCLIQ